MARRASHTQRRFDRQAQPPPDEVAAKLLDDWRRTRPDADTWHATPRGANGAPVVEGVEYRVERLDAGRRPALQAAARIQAELTARAAEGWRLRAIVPAPPHDQLAIFERFVEPVPEPEAGATGAGAAGGQNGTAAKPARPRRSRRPAAGQREWEAARKRFATERAGELDDIVARPPFRYRRPHEAVDIRNRRITVVALLAVGAVLLAIIAIGGGDDDAPTARVAPQAPPAAVDERADGTAAPVVPRERSESGSIRPCRDVPAGAERSGPVTCSTNSRVLTIAGPGHSVELAGVKNRVLRVRREPGTIVVTVGIRNRSSAALDAQDLPGRTAFVAGAVKLGPAAGVASDVIKPGGASETDLRFATTDAAEAALARTDGRADLGIASTQEGAQSRRAGVLRMSVPDAS